MLEPDGDDTSEDGDTEFMPLAPMTARGSLITCSSPEYMFQGRPGLGPPVERVEETKLL